MGRCRSWIPRLPRLYYVLGTSGFEKQKEVQQEQRETLANHHHLTGEMLEFNSYGSIFELRCFHREQITKYYIGYSIKTIFVIFPQAKPPFIIKPSLF